jgi:hypothetical protein
MGSNLSTLSKSRLQGPFLRNLFFYKKSKLAFGWKHITNKPLLFIYCSRSSKFTFFNGFSTKKCKIFNALKFSCYTSIHSPPKKSLQNCTHNLNFEVYLQLFMLCDMNFFNTNILYMFKFVNVCWIYFLIN